MNGLHCLAMSSVLLGVLTPLHAADIWPYQKQSQPPLADVTVDDAFWSPRIRVNHEVTLPYCFDICENTGRVDNFRKAGGLIQGPFVGIWFNDSDVYKVVQAAAHAAAIRPDPALEKLSDNVIRAIAAAQQPDGYLYCFFTIDHPDQRWRNIVNPARHEMYCMGHLIEAAAVHYELTGKRELLDVGCRLADHIGSVFGPGKRYDVPEHQELELGLLALYRVTGETDYLTLARFFIDQRGNAEGHSLYGDYSQDHLPVREQSHAVGHAVRAMYNAAGMVDLHMATGDRELLAAARRIWESATHRKMYVTGGVGSTARGEAFAGDYELPNDTAYAETCAAIGLVFFAERMFQVDPDAEYIDVLERALYNGVLSGVSLSGKKFFYQNRLATKGDYRRRDWYSCACCPSNIIRVLPRVGQMAYAVDKRSVYANLYVGGEARLTVGNSSVVLRQETRYPWDGAVRFTVESVESDEDGQFDLCLRIPGWLRDAETPGRLYATVDSSSPVESFSIRLNDRSIDTGPLEKGYARISRRWKSGDVVQLNLPMPARRIRAHDRVEADRGRVALQRGPIVYCVEAVDHGGRVSHLSLPFDVAVTHHYEQNLLGGVTVLTARTAAPVLGEEELKPVELLAVPYYAWDNRQGGPMAVWLPEDAGMAQPAPKPTIASTAVVSASFRHDSDAVSAVNDQIDPPNSSDLTTPRHTWWNHLGTQEWVQYIFADPATVSAVEVYWFDDRATGGCLVPESWRLSALVDGSWEAVSGASPYGVEPDRYNRVTFAPILASGLRIDVQLRPNRSGGVLEWKVIGEQVGGL